MEDQLLPQRPIRPSVVDNELRPIVDDDVDYDTFDGQEDDDEEQGNGLTDKQKKENALKRAQKEQEKRAVANIVLQRINRKDVTFDHSEMFKHWSGYDIKSTEYVHRIGPSKNGKVLPTHDNIIRTDEDIDRADEDVDMDRHQQQDQRPASTPVVIESTEQRLARYSKFMKLFTTERYWGAENDTAMAVRAETGNRMSTQVRHGIAQQCDMTLADLRPYRSNKIFKHVKDVAKQVAADTQFALGKNKPIRVNVVMDIWKRHRRQQYIVEGVRMQVGDTKESWGSDDIVERALAFRQNNKTHTLHKCLVNHPDASKSWWFWDSEDFSQARSTTDKGVFNDINRYLEQLVYKGIDWFRANSPIVFHTGGRKDNDVYQKLAEDKSIAAPISAEGIQSILYAVVQDPFLTVDSILKSKEYDGTLDGKTVTQVERILTHAGFKRGRARAATGTDVMSNPMTLREIQDFVNEFQRKHVFGPKSRKGLLFMDETTVSATPKPGGHWHARGHTGPYVGGSKTKDKGIYNLFLACGVFPDGAPFIWYKMYVAQSETMQIMRVIYNVANTYGEDEFEQQKRNMQNYLMYILTPKTMPKSLALLFKKLQENKHALPYTAMRERIESMRQLMGQPLETTQQEREDVEFVDEMRDAIDKILLDGYDISPDELAGAIADTVRMLIHNAENDPDQNEKILPNIMHDAFGLNQFNFKRVRASAYRDFIVTGAHESLEKLTINTPDQTLQGILPTVIGIAFFGFQGLTIYHKNAKDSRLSNKLVAGGKPVKVLGTIGTTADAYFGTWNIAAEPVTSHPPDNKQSSSRLIRTGRSTSIGGFMQFAMEQGHLKEGDKMFSLWDASGTHMTVDKSFTVLTSGDNWKFAARSLAEYVYKRNLEAICGDGKVKWQILVTPRSIPIYNPCERMIGMLKASLGRAYPYKGLMTRKDIMNGICKWTKKECSATTIIRAIRATSYQLEIDDDVEARVENSDTTLYKMALELLGPVHTIQEVDSDETICNNPSVFANLPGRDGDKSVVCVSKRTNQIVKSYVPRRIVPTSDKTQYNRWNIHSTHAALFEDLQPFHVHLRNPEQINNIIEQGTKFTGIDQQWIQARIQKVVDNDNMIFTSSGYDLPESRRSGAQMQEATTYVNRLLDQHVASLIDNKPTGKYVVGLRLFYAMYVLLMCPEYGNAIVRNVTMFRIQRDNTRVLVRLQMVMKRNPGEKWCIYCYLGLASDSKAPAQYTFPLEYMRANAYLLQVVRKKAQSAHKTGEWFTDPEFKPTVLIEQQEETTDVPMEDTTTDAPTDESTDAQIDEAPTEESKPRPKPADAPMEEPMEEPIEELMEEPIEESKPKPADTQTQGESTTGSVPSFVEGVVELASDTEESESPAEAANGTAEPGPPVERASDAEERDSGMDDPDTSESEFSVKDSDDEAQTDIDSEQPVTNVQTPVPPVTTESETQTVEPPVTNASDDENYFDEEENGSHSMLTATSLRIAVPINKGNWDRPPIAPANPRSNIPRAETNLASAIDRWRTHRVQGDNVGQMGILAKARELTHIAQFRKSFKRLEEQGYYYLSVWNKNANKPDLPAKWFLLLIVDRKPEVRPKRTSKRKTNEVNVTHKKRARNQATETTSQIDVSNMVSGAKQGSKRTRSGKEKAEIAQAASKAGPQHPQFKPGQVTYHFRPLTDKAGPIPGVERDADNKIIFPGGPLPELPAYDDSPKVWEDKIGGRLNTDNTFHFDGPPARSTDMNTTEEGPNPPGGNDNEDIPQVGAGDENIEPDASQMEAGDNDNEDIPDASQMEPGYELHNVDISDAPQSETSDEDSSDEEIADATNVKVLKRKEIPEITEITDQPPNNKSRRRLPPPRKPLPEQVPFERKTQDKPVITTKLVQQRRKPRKLPNIVTKGVARMRPDKAFSRKSASDTSEPPDWVKQIWKPKPVEGSKRKIAICPVGDSQQPPQQPPQQQQQQQQQPQPVPQTVPPPQPQPVPQTVPPPQPQPVPQTVPPPQSQQPPQQPPQSVPQPQQQQPPQPQQQQPPQPPSQTVPPPEKQPVAMEVDQSQQPQQQQPLQLPQPQPYVPTIVPVEQSLPPTPTTPVRQKKWMRDLAGTENSLLYEPTIEQVGPDQSLGITRRVTRGQARRAKRGQRLQDAEPVQLSEWTETKQRRQK